MGTHAGHDIAATLLGRTRSSILGLVLSRPDEEFHVRQIARLSGAALSPVQRDLKLLANLGLLSRREVGSQVLYRADPASPIHKELAALLLKTAGAAGVIATALRPLAPRIHAAFLFGSFARQTQTASSDIDVMAIGDVPFSTLAAALQPAQQQLAREINPSLYHPAEFAAKLRQRHHFLTSILAAPKVFLVGDDRELSRLAEAGLAPTPQDKPQRNRKPPRRR